MHAVHLEGDINNFKHLKIYHFDRGWFFFSLSQSTNKQKQQSGHFINLTYKHMHENYC